MTEQERQKLQAEFDELDSKIKRTDGQIKQNAARADIERHAQLSNLLAPAEMSPSPTNSAPTPPRAAGSVPEGKPEPDHLTHLRRLRDIRQDIQADVRYFREPANPRGELAIKSIDQAIAALGNAHKAMGLIE